MKRRRCFCQIHVFYYFCCCPVGAIGTSKVSVVGRDIFLQGLMAVRIRDSTAIDHVSLWHSFIWGNCQHQSDQANECGVKPAVSTQNNIPVPAVQLVNSSLCQRGSHTNVIIVPGKGHSWGTSKRAHHRENEKKAVSCDAHRCTALSGTLSFALKVLTGSKWGLWQHLPCSFSLHTAAHTFCMIYYHVRWHALVISFKCFRSAYKLCRRMELKVIISEGSNAFSRVFICILQWNTKR